MKKKTKFYFLKPWLSWSKKKYGDCMVTHRAIGFPTVIDYMNHDTEWSFEIAILGFGFMVERFPVTSKPVREATKRLAEVVKGKRKK